MTIKLDDAEIKKIEEYKESLWSRISVSNISDDEIEIIENMMDIYSKNKCFIEIVESDLADLIDLYAMKASLNHVKENISFNAYEGIIDLLENIEKGFIHDIDQEYVIEPIETNIPIDDKNVSLEINLASGEIHYRNEFDTWNTKEF